ncbi:MAG TPA: amidophosphoribosyltransferase [Deltaproteobacteria bacterium]|nr:amidophosphoribosyltransferase [Deltaproteobacteria bacterium]
MSEFVFDSIQSTPWSRWKAWFRACLAPPTCELCESLVPQVPALCPDCAEGLQLLGAALCARCALPFSATDSRPHLCGVCLAKPPSFEKAVSVFRFEKSAAQLLHRVKFSGRIQAFAPFFPEAAVKFRNMVESFAPERILPMPLSWRRRFRRGFNQSAVLAEELQRRSGCRIPWGPPVRRRFMTPQARKNRAERLQAMRGAFQVRHNEIWRGRRVLLVDDVLTTGASADALSAALLRAGAQRVQVFTLARVGRRI